MSRFYVNVNVITLSLVLSVRALGEEDGQVDFAPFLIGSPFGCDGTLLQTGKSNMDSWRAELAFKGVWPEHLPELILNRSGTSSEYRTRWGIVLVHGLGESPRAMRKTAQLYSEFGFNVVSILLDGSGSRPEDMKDASLDVWHQNLERGIDIAKMLSDEIYCGGYSIGAGVCLTSTNSFAGYALHSPLIKMSDLGRREYDQVLANWLDDGKTSSQWLQQNPDFSEDFDSQGRYTRQHINGYRIAKEIENAIEEGISIDVPVVAAFPRRDRIADPSATIQFAGRQQLPTHMIFELSSRDHDASLVGTGRMEDHQFAREFPDRDWTFDNILSSMILTLVRPDDGLDIDQWFDSDPGRQH